MLTALDLPASADMEPWRDRQSTLREQLPNAEMTAALGTTRMPSNRMGRGLGRRHRRTGIWTDR